MLTTPHIKCTKNFKRNPEPQLSLRLSPSNPPPKKKEKKNTTYIDHDLRNVIDNTSLWARMILVSVSTHPLRRLIRTLLPQAPIQTV